MMQQTMEASHTDSIQVQSWTLGLRQVNPSCGHTFNFFFTVCFWNRASVSVGQSRLHLQKQLSTIKKNHWRNFSLEGVRDYPFEYSVLFTLKHLCFTAQKKRIWSLLVGNFSPKLNISVLPGTFWLLYLCYQVVCISSSLWCPDLQRDSNKGNTKWHSK